MGADHPCRHPMTSPTLKKRNPVIAGLLSLVFPGLGHVYVGEARRGLVMLGAAYLLILLLGAGGMLSRLWGYGAMVALLIALPPGAVIDSVLLARRRGAVTPKPYNKWYVYAAGALLLLAIPNLVASNRGLLLGYETYRHAAGGMQPTLLPGDYFLADTRGYPGARPARGDIIAFRFPPEPGVIYIKRVVAVGPAKVALRAGRLLIDGREAGEPWPHAPALTPYSLEMPEKTLTADDVFVLGDHRDDSNDSRMWGAVPVENILARATDIWWSDDSARIGRPVR
jgi:signal peptidase I